MKFCPQFQEQHDTARHWHQNEAGHPADEGEAAPFRQAQQFEFVLDSGEPRAVGEGQQELGVRAGHREHVHSGGGSAKEGVS